MSIKHMHKPTKQVHMEEAAIQAALLEMISDSGLKTDLDGFANPSRASAETSFYEKHMSYLKSHPKVNPAHYLANLRTMIKIRS